MKKIIIGLIGALIVVLVLVFTTEKCHNCGKKLYSESYTVFGYHFCEDCVGEDFDFWK